MSADGDLVCPAEECEDSSCSRTGESLCRDSESSGQLRNTGVRVRSSSTPGPRCSSFIATLRLRDRRLPPMAHIRPNTSCTRPWRSRMASAIGSRPVFTSLPVRKPRRMAVGRRSYPAPVRVPESWKWPVGVSLSLEIGYQRAVYSPDTGPWRSGLSSTRPSASGISASIRHWTGRFTGHPYRRAWSFRQT